MTYDEFIRTVVESDPNDWVYDDSKEKFIFKNDLMISIVGKEIDYSENGRFYEDWVMLFADPVARRREFELCYAGNEIETFYTVMVDGARMYIPYPKLNDMTISKNQYSLGKIINIMNKAYGFDYYLNRAKIVVE